MAKRTQTGGGSRPGPRSTSARSTPAAPTARRATRRRPRRRRRSCASSHGLQERLYAEGKQSLLVVLQAIDAGGKDGTIKHVFRRLNPAGCRVASFKVPSEEERSHDFLWRVHAKAPAKGEVVVFNRSHYEDVLVVRVHGLVPEDGVAAPLRPHQRLRGQPGRRRHPHRQALPAHLQGGAGRALPGPPRRPPKRWKFRKGDLDERARWDDYVAAFEEAISPDVDGGRAVVRRPRRPQVVPQLGRQPHPGRDPRGHGPAVPAGGGPDRGRRLPDLLGRRASPTKGKQRWP